MQNEPYSSYLSTAYVLLAALAGAVTALSFRGWKDMTAREVALTLFVGASFAIFVTPWLAQSWFGPNVSLRAMAALIYISGSASNTILPMLIRWFIRKFGDEEARA